MFIFFARAGVIVIAASESFPRRRDIAQSNRNQRLPQTKDLPFYLEDGEMCDRLVALFWFFMFDHLTDESLNILFMCCLLIKKKELFEKLRARQLGVSNFAAVGGWRRGRAV